MHDRISDKAYGIIEAHDRLLEEWAAIVPMARDLGIPVPASSVTENMLRATVAKGMGDDDFCSAIRILEDWTGTVIKKRES